MNGKHIARLQSSQEVVHEPLCREIENLPAGMHLADTPRNGVQQVGFAQTRIGMQVESGLKLTGKPGAVSETRRAAE